MKFQITYVEFDFDGEDEMTAYDQDITTAEGDWYDLGCR
jgi:hypothetical protein